MPGERALVLSCEHATNAVPARYRPLFARAQRVLASHRGWDPGALELARRLARATGAPLHAGRATRLLVDLNRSPHHPQLFSSHVASLPDAEKERIVERHYLPYRRAVERDVELATRRAPTLHLSFHSFTPVLRGVRREVDIGLLYDPSRPTERRFADALARALAERAPRLRVRRNQPYKGTDDGFIPHLRRLHPDALYAGFELELNQRFPRGEPQRWQRLQETLVAALLTAVREWESRGGSRAPAR